MQKEKVDVFLSFAHPIDLFKRKNRTFPALKMWQG